MARGWESKSVESQQADALDNTRERKPRLTSQQAQRAREREGLLLSRKHVLDQINNASNPRLRQMLESALAELDAKLARLE
jgi:hypothetical protein